MGRPTEMISPNLLQRAIERVASLRYFPTGNPEAKTMVGEILHELCDDDADIDRAIGIIPRIVPSEWEGPAELRAKLQAALEVGRPLPKACERCAERDMVISVCADGSRVAGRCSCLRGKRLSELDAKRRLG